MLTEETKVDKMEILADGQVQVREATVVYRDGVEIARSNHRYVLDPGKDEPGAHAGKVRAVIDVVWTPSVVGARKDFLGAQHAKNRT